jgi:signal transduction histidine kinase
MEDPAVRVVSAVEAERRGLERRLHAGVQRQLVAVTVNLQLLDQLCATDAAAAKTLLAEIRDEVRDALRERNEAAQQPPAPFATLDLRRPASIEPLAHLLEVPHGIPLPPHSLSVAARP